MDADFQLSTRNHTFLWLYTDSYSSQEISNPKFFKNSVDKHSQSAPYLNTLPEHLSPKNYNLKKSLTHSKVGTNSETKKSFQILPMWQEKPIFACWANEKLPPGGAPRGDT